MDPAFIAKYDQRVPRYTSYPTAPHFSSAVGADAYRQWLADLPADAALSLYLHIPYCDTLCWFCGCHTKIVRRYDPVARYVAHLRREIDRVADIVDGRGMVGHVHWGGGTPTILGGGDIEALADHLRTRFAFRTDAEFAVEIDPRELARETVASLGRAGVTRASIGVQDVNPEVQQAINRVQPWEVTARVVAWLREEGVGAINMDLMYGLPLQTDERLANTVRQVLTQAPNRIALFGYAHVPWMKPHQRLIDEAALPSPAARLSQRGGVAARLGDAGYARIGLDHFATADDPLTLAQRGGRLHRNFQGYTTDAASALLGFGASAIGTLPQGYVQNATPIHAYLDTVAAGELTVVRGIAIDDDDRLRRAVIERLMCDLEVDVAAQCRRFGQAGDALSAEMAALRPLQDDGLVAVDGHRVRVPEEARPLLRAVCAVFDRYLDPSETRHARAV